MKEYFALTERRSEEAKRIRREFREQHGKDFSPRRGKVIVPREDGLSNCVTATQGVEQYLFEIIDDFISKGERNLTKTNEVKTEVSGKPFTYVSLFSGIGGFETALNKLGGTCVLASEIDRFANQSYEALYGHATAGDITKIQAEDVPDHDVLVGGFPCQAFSVAGKRGGFDDARGTLFFEVARLAKTKQPRMLLLENVKGLVGHDGGKTLDTIVQTLNDIGYHVDFNVLNSKYFGVPQNRERIFIVAIRDDIAKPVDWIIEGTNVVAKGKRRIAAYDGVKTFNFEWPSQTEVTTRLRDILETEVDEKYYLSDEKTSALVAQLDEGLAIREATKQGYAIATEGDAVNFQFPDSKTRRGRVGKQIANTLEASNINQGVVEAEVRSCSTRTRAYAGKPEALEIRKDFVSNTVTSVTKDAYVLSAPKYRIRKLSPRECWRLQNFSDEQFDTAKAAGLSDSQLYKQAGNSITTSVVTALALKMLEMELL